MYKLHYNNIILKYIFSHFLTFFRSHIRLHVNFKKHVLRSNLFIIILKTIHDYIMDILLMFILFDTKHDMFKVNILWPLKNELCPTLNSAHFFLWKCWHPNQTITVENKLYLIFTQIHHYFVYFWDTKNYDYKACTWCKYIILQYVSKKFVPITWPNRS